MSDSFTGWWRAAGLDSAVGDAPRNWLTADLQAETKEAAPSRVEPEAAKRAASPAPLASAPLPSDIAALQSAIAAGDALPGNLYGRQYAAPIGEAGAALMVISDLPDPDEFAAGSFGAGASGRLLRAMLAACRINLSQCYWTALATSAPPTGELPDHELEKLAAFVRHQIDLVKPNVLLLLGTAASRAMLGIEMFEARGSLRDINHDGGNKAVLASFHPRTLIAQPNLKAKAWEDLQMLKLEEAP